jgi:hypothetical protein
MKMKATAALLNKVIDPWAMSIGGNGITLLIHFERISAIIEEIGAFTSSTLCNGSIGC